MNWCFGKSCLVTLLLGVLWVGEGQTAAQPTSQEELRRRVVELKAELAAAEQQLALSENPSVASNDWKAVAEPEKEKAIEQEFPVWSYTIRLPISIGYETNPTGLSEDLPRPAGLSHKDSFVIRLNPSLKVNFETTKEITWLFRYDLLHDFYMGRADINTDNHTFIIGRQQKFNDGRDVLTTTVRDDLLRVDEEGNANQFSVGPEWEKFLDTEKRWSSVVKYSFNINSFALPDGRKIAEVADPDSQVHVAGIAARRVIRKKDELIPDDKEFKLTVGYEHSWQDADGKDFDRQRNRLTLDVEGRPFPKGAGVLQPLGLEVRYRHDFDDYDHLNSRAGALGYQFERDDNIDDVTSVLSYPLNFEHRWKQTDKTIKSSLFVSYHYDRRDSNVVGQDKDNHALRLGVIGDF